MKVVLQRLLDLEEIVQNPAVAWWSVETTVECPYGDYRGVVALTYSVLTESTEEDADRIHGMVWRRITEDPWSVAEQTRRHRDECWSRYLGPPHLTHLSRLGQDDVGAPVPGAERSGTRPDGYRGPVDETGGS